MGVIDFAALAEFLSESFGLWRGNDECVVLGWRQARVLEEYEV